jgi:hypothetical protein
MVHDRLLGDDAARASGNGNGGSTSDRRRSNGRGTGRDLALRGRKLGTVPGDASGESPEALRMVDASRREILTSLAVQPFRRATHGGTHTGGSPVALRSGGATEPDVCARAGRAVLAGVARQAATDERCGAACEPPVWATATAGGRSNGKPPVRRRASRSIGWRLTSASLTVGASRRSAAPTR